MLSPTIQSAVGIQAWGKFAGEVDLAKLLDDLRTRVEKVQGGDMRPVEAMLYGQAVTLQTIFTSLARRATSQEYLKQFQAYLGLALKAQAQCRATLEALAEIKNPRPVAFVKQATISGGHQQVNNGMQPAQQAGSAQVGGGSNLCPRLKPEPRGIPRRDFFPLWLKFKRQETQRRLRDQGVSVRHRAPAHFRAQARRRAGGTKPRACKTDY